MSDRAVTDLVAGARGFLADLPLHGAGQSNTCGSTQTGEELVGAHSLAFAFRHRRVGNPAVRDSRTEEAMMSGEERQPEQAGSAGEDREREEDARRARAEAEAERAAAERDAEIGSDEEDGVVPADTDKERMGVMRPPAGSGAE